MTIDKKEYDQDINRYTKYLKSIGDLRMTGKNGHDVWLGNSQELMISEISRAMWVLERSFKENVIEKHKSGGDLEFFSIDLMTCHLCGQHCGSATLIGNELKIYKYREKRHVGLEKCEINGSEPYTVEIDIPSGEMVVANELRDLFPKLNTLDRYPHYSLNCLGGRKHCTEWYAQHGYVEMNVGNCSCVMYQTNKTADKFVIGATNCVVGKKEVADVCTGFWGYGVTDYALAVKNGLGKLKADNPYSDYEIVHCKPGRYRFAHEYHLHEDDGSRYIYTRIGLVK